MLQVTLAIRRWFSVVHNISKRRLTIWLMRAGLWLSSSKL